MKKPVRKTTAEIEALCAKRKTQTRTESRAIKPGDLVGVGEQFRAFADKFGVSVTDVRLGSNYGYVCLIAKRPETEAEKFKRIKEAENYKYSTALYQWEREEERRKREIADAEAVLRRNTPLPVHKVTVNCCKCKCGCA